MRIFSKWGSYLWPIQSGEYRKFFTMLFLFMLISFNYSLLRVAKDTLIVTAPLSGAEAIPFIKVWVLLPAAFLMTWIFTKISNRYGREKVFTVMISIFLLFFILFTFILYPAREHLHPIALIEKWRLHLPQGMQGLLALLRNWVLTLYYVMSELWGSAILSVLFWGFANEVTKVAEAKRFYALFGLGANIATIGAGKIAILLSSQSFIPQIPFGTTGWDQTILFLNSTVILSGLGIIFVFRHLNRNVLHQEDSTFSLKEKEKLTLKQTFAFLLRSKYLLCIALIVIAYNVSLNLVEVLWKNQIKILFPLPCDFNAYMGHVLMMVGILATIIALFITNNLLRKFGWTFSALVAPLIVFVSGIIFFFCYLFKGFPMLQMIAGAVGSTPLALAVFFGAMQNVFTRASKYTLFDATKEIAFIPLSPESKLKGKAAIDGVCSRIGKSGGAVIHQSLLLFLSTFTAAAPYVAIAFFIVIAIWFLAVSTLGKQFAALTEKAPI